VAEQRVNPAAIDDRVDFSQKKKNGRSAGAEVHRPDGVAAAVRNVTKKSLDLSGGRAVRAQISAGPPKAGGRFQAAIHDRVDFGAKKATDGRRAAAEVHQPDSAAPAASNVTQKSNELTAGRAVRARTASSPQKKGS
jgi:hypothetical protein